MMYLLLSLSVVCLSVEAQTGAAGQDCTPDQGDFPEVCTTSGQVVASADKIECEANFDCCLCGTLLCSPDCDGFKANGDSSAFGVPNIVINGDSDGGAEIDCDGDSSCQDSTITATNVKNIKCGGDLSCNSAVISATCLSEDGCKVECDGDQSCEDGSLTINYASNIGCSDQGCQRAYMNIINPIEDFKLECDATEACREAVVTIVISDGIEIDQIACSGEQGCREAEIHIVNEGTSSVNIKQWDCAGLNACADAVFILTGNINVEECKCSADGCTNLSTTGFSCSE